VVSEALRCAEGGAVGDESTHHNVEFGFGQITSVAYNLVVHGKPFKVSDERWLMADD
jgi:hypothetical protein